MDNAGTVRRGERLGDLDAVGQCLVQGQLATRETSGKRFTVQVLHHQKGSSILVTNVEERADARMRERGDRSGFSFEPLSCGRVPCQFPREDLERYGAIQPRIARFVDLAHAASAELSDHLIAANPGAGGNHGWIMLVG